MTSLILAAATALVITHDEGGRVDHYAARIAAETRPVVIDGLCESACTMYLGARDVCVTDKARFIFHRPRNSFLGELPPVAFWQAVDTISSHYPDRLATWYRAVVVHGGFHTITGQQMIDWYDVEECG